MKATKIFIIRYINEDEIIGATNSEENAIKMMKERLIAESGLSPQYWLDCHYNPFEKANTHYVIVEAEDPDEEYEFEIIPIVYQEVK